MNSSHIRWFEIAPIIVYIGEWFVVGALAVLFVFMLLQLFEFSEARLQVSAVAVFLLVEGILLSYVYSYPNFPPWFEAFFLFNGYAIPLQAAFALGITFSRKWRAICASLGAFLTLALPVVWALSPRGVSA